MTREEAAKILKECRERKLKYTFYTLNEYQAATDMAIKALEQEPCEDVISRQDVVKAVDKHTNDDGTLDDDITCILEDVPSVTPQQKVGRWITVSERLPEDSELVLFSTKTDRVFEGRYFADNTDRQWYAFRDETFAWNNVVTAWMPLPQPYNTKSED